MVEGYTDVIAAHQVGLCNVVGTLGTALGDDHVRALRRLADRVVLVFDGDEAGQKAADRSLELFLGHEVDVRVLTLPANLDPCDFLLKEGADAFRALVERAVDPLAFVLDRAAARFDLDSIEESRQAAEWVLAILGRVPQSNRVGPRRQGRPRSLDTLSQRLRRARSRRSSGGSGAARSARGRGAGRRPAAPATAAGATPGRQSAGGPPAAAGGPDPAGRPRPDRPRAGRDRPERAGRGRPCLISRVAAASLRDAPLRAILQACYDLHGEGQPPTFERVMLAARRPGGAGPGGRPAPADRPGAPCPRMCVPPPGKIASTGVLARLAERERQDRLRDLKAALDETDRDRRPGRVSGLATGISTSHDPAAGHEEEDAS